MEDLLAIQDQIVLLYGRLSLIGAKSQMAIQYNAVARSQLRESILWLRGRVAGPVFPVRPSFVWIEGKGEERPQSELPYKWAYMLAHRDDLRIDAEAGEMVAVGDVVELGAARRGPSTGIALLGPRELVVAAEPLADRRTHRYGVDLTVVPRSHIRDVGWSRGNLQIRLRAGDEARPADGTRKGARGATGEPAISLPLDSRLFEAMRRSFGDAVEWAKP